MLYSGVLLTVNSNKLCPLKQSKNVSCIYVTLICAILVTSFVVVDFYAKNVILSQMSTEAHLDSQKSIKTVDF